MGREAADQGVPQLSSLKVHLSPLGMLIQALERFVLRVPKQQPLALNWFG